MKVLVTGVTGAQVGTGSRYALHSAVPGVVRALRHLGHEVDHRPVEFEEPLARYDLAVVFLAGPSVLGAYHLCGALWTVDKVAKVVLAMDDWAAPSQVLGGLRTVATRAEGGLWRYQNGIRRRDQDRWRKHERRLQAVAASLAENEAQRGIPLLLPLWPWGDPESLRRTGILGWPAFGFDPTPFLPELRSEVPEPRPGRRARVWVHATASTQASWQRFKRRLTWDVREFGGSRLGNRGTQGERRRVWLSTAECAAEYAAARCTVVPAYDRTKVPPTLGWWRTRLVQAVWAGSIPYNLDRLEGPGTAFRCRPEPEVLEHLSDSELDELARVRADVVLSHLGTAEVEADRVALALASAS